MKRVKKLTKANCEKYGIQVALEYDFNDDGNKFRGFIYKGIPMTQCYADGIAYLCIRVDYLENNFTYREWMATDEYHLCDEFNGVSEFDIEKLIENLEAVIAKVNELNEKSFVTEAELEDVKSVVENEVAKIEVFIEEVKKNFKWWEVEGYIVNHVKAYMKTLSDKAKHGSKIVREIDCMELRTQKEYVERTKRAISNPTNEILGASFYMKEIAKYVK